MEAWSHWQQLQRHEVGYTWECNSGVVGEGGGEERDKMGDTGPWMMGSSATRAIGFSFCLGQFESVLVSSLNQAVYGLSLDWRQAAWDICVGARLSHPSLCCDRRRKPREGQSRQERAIVELEESRSSSWAHCVRRVSDWVRFEMLSTVSGKETAPGLCLGHKASFYLFKHDGCPASSSACLPH